MLKCAQNFQKCPEITKKFQKCPKVPSLKKEKRKIYKTQIILTTISKINQIQNIIQISISLHHIIIIQEAEP
jgi:hypothetical protein